MIAVDSALLVHAHRSDSPHHEAAKAALASLAARTATWAIPWPAVHEFLAVITDDREWQPPTPKSVALDALEALTRADNLAFIHETPHHGDLVIGLLREAGARRELVEDARIAAICIGNGIKELWTADRDYSWFPDLQTHNPLTTKKR